MGKMANGAEYSVSGPSEVDFSVSARPRGSEGAGGREKTKTKNGGPRGPPGALSAFKPSPKGAQSRQGRGPEGGHVRCSRGQRVGPVGVDDYSSHCGGRIWPINILLPTWDAGS